jgi:molybdopterin/thiamine biosynthesis adenylyltransferase
MDHTRHIGLFNARHYSATLIGAGGIGAITALALSKMGLGSLIIYDGDKVEEVNIPVQFHRLSDVGKPKSEAVERVIQDYVDDVRVIGICDCVMDHTILKPTHVMISAVDSIQARQQIWVAVQRAQPLWYVDARMSAEYFQMYVVEMRNPQWYQDSLMGQDDATILDEPCTAKATIYTACMAAGHIGAAFRRILTGLQTPGIVTHDILKDQLGVLPFKTDS